VVSLRQLAELLRIPGLGGAASKAALARRCEALAAEVEAAVEAHGVFEHAAAGGRVYAYEVDGYGNASPGR
jgi:meiotically up-regulated gene 157 (Mug157) protein